MGGSGQSKLGKVEKYLDKNDEKSLMHFLQSNKLPADYTIKYYRGKTCQKQCHFEEDVYILHYAAVNCTTSILQYLLLNQFQSVIDQKTSQKKTPLMYAVKFERVEQITLLQKSGAEVNATDINGDCALHFASRTGNLEVVKALLVFQNVNLSIRNKYKNTPQDDAAHLKHTAIVEELSRHLHRSSTADSGINYSDISSCSWKNSNTWPEMSHVESRLSGNNPDIGGLDRDCVSPTEGNVQESAGFYLPEDRKPSDNQTGHGMSESDEPIPSAGCNPKTKDGLLDERFQHQIRHNYNNLKLQLMVDEVLPIMFSRGHLTRLVFEKIDSQPHCSKKITALIEVLFTFTNQRFEEFLLILEETNQEALANEIRKTPVTTEKSGKSSLRESSQVILRKRNNRSLAKRELAHSMAHLHTLAEDQGVTYGQSGLEEKYAEL